MLKYVITNFGNTRKLPYNGEYYELTKNCSIETDNKELADTLGGYQFIGVEVSRQPEHTEKKKSKKQTTKKSKRKTRSK